MPLPPQRIPYSPPSDGSGPQFYMWAQAVTRALNELPFLSEFSGDPRSVVTAEISTLGFNLADSSATSAVWVKRTTLSNTGWFPIG